MALQAIVVLCACPPSDLLYDDAAEYEEEDDYSDGVEYEDYYDHYDEARIPAVVSSDMVRHGMQQLVQSVAAATVPASPATVQIMDESTLTAATVRLPVVQQRTWT